MLKQVVMMVLIMVVGLIVINYVILPFVVDALDIPSLATWIGLEGFLKILPFMLVAGLVAGVILGLFRRGQDTEDDE